MSLSHWEYESELEWEHQVVGLQLAIKLNYSAKPGILK